MLDLRVFQISHQLTRNIGLHVPNTFNLFNIPAVALAGLGGTEYSATHQPVNCFRRHQPGGQYCHLRAFSSQSTGQQNTIFSQPLATFGGGLTFMGLSLDQIAAAALRQ